MSGAGSAQAGATMHFFARRRKPASVSAAIMLGAIALASWSLARMTPRSPAQALTRPRSMALSSELMAAMIGPKKRAQNAPLMGQP
eukprot:256154-Pyramimonas_sp.AAC.1